MRDALKPDEAEAFGNALWSDIDAQDNGLPANTGLNPGILQQLPAGNGIDAKARVTARLLSTNLSQEMRLGLQDSAQMRLVQDDDMVNTFAPDRSDQPFGKAVLPRRGWCSRLVPDPHGA
jgi:hypothetical protein